MWLLIENGDVYRPNPMGRRSVLVTGGAIANVGSIDRRDVEALEADLDVIDATGCTVIPGIIDPHVHLLGESGPRDLADRSPEVHASELARAGVTTAVGCLGVDAGTTTMQALLARAKALRQQQVGDVHVWTGGSRARATILETACADLVTFTEVIGAGEVAEFRAAAWDTGALASLASDAYLGGTLSGKAGVTHFHVDTRDARLPALRAAATAQRVPADRICFLIRDLHDETVHEAVRCAEWGAFIGVGAGASDAEEWIVRYLDRGGDPRRLTLFSDAPRAQPRSILDRVFSFSRSRGWPLASVLPWATANPAAMLRLRDRGGIERERRADVVVIRKRSLEIVEVIAAGRRIVRNGEVVLEATPRSSAGG